MTKNGFREEREFLNRSNANKQRTWRAGIICGNLNYLCCAVYYGHELLLYVCTSSAVSTSFPIKIEFVDHGIGSGLIMPVRKKKSK